MTKSERPGSSWVHTLTQRLLKATGRGHAIDPSIGPGSLIGELVTRGTQLLRGLLRLGRPVFLGRGIKIRGRGGLSLAPGASIGDGCFLDARGTDGIVIGRGSRVGRNGVVTAVSRLSLRGAGLSIGTNSGVGDSFHLGCSGGVLIGDDVIVGPGLYVHSQEHIFDEGDKPIRAQGTRELPVTVSDDCWIGSRVTLLGGTVLGPRTVVASGAVVKGVHRGHEVLAGVPAKRVQDLLS